MHPDHQSIGELAYRLWQARGSPQGTAEQDWLEAERQLTEQTPFTGQTVKNESPPSTTRSRERSTRTRALVSKPVAIKPNGDFAA
jgi:LmbE family N-acetylglucosaminyl deacetylase